MPDARPIPVRMTPQQLRRWRVCVHESGHCVCGVALGLRCVQAAIGADGSGSCGFEPTGIDGEPKARVNAVMTWGGQLATAMMLPPDRFGRVPEEMRADSDLPQIIGLAGNFLPIDYSAELCEKWIQDARRRAAVVIGANAAAVKSVASHLFWLGSITSNHPALAAVHVNKRFAAPFASSPKPKPSTPPPTIKLARADELARWEICLHTAGEFVAAMALGFRNPKAGLKKSDVTGLAYGCTFTAEKNVDAEGIRRGAILDAAGQAATAMVLPPSRRARLRAGYADPSFHAACHLDYLATRAAGDNAAAFAAEARKRARALVLCNAELVRQVASRLMWLGSIDASDPMLADLKPDRKFAACWALPARPAAALAAPPQTATIDDDPSMLGRFVRALEALGRPVVRTVQRDAKGLVEQVTETRHPLGVT